MNQLLFSDTFDPHRNLAIESTLMNAVRPGDMCLYLWQNKHTVVVGRNQNAWKECRCELLKAEGGVLARRSSGGGAVYHDLGNLNFTFAASPERYDLNAQLSMITGALNSIGIDARFTGRNDITVDGRKFSGNAFKYTKTCSMQHGTLLVNADLENLSRYLRPSESKLRAKGIQSVRSRVCNLSEFKSGLTIQSLKSLLADAFREKYGSAAEISADSLDISGIYPLYASWEWNYGETPRFDISMERRFTWGGVEITLALKNGAVESVAAFTDAMDVDIPDKIIAALTGAEYGSALADRLAFMPELRDWLKEELPV